MRWPGFRRVRSQVCKRIDRRSRELGLADLDAYRRHLQTHEDEWQLLDALCRITISRFFRDRAVFDTLAREVFPALVGGARERGGEELRIWSAGCASGEEPYSLSILWASELRSRYPGTKLDIVATDADAGMIGRAREARYESGSVRDVPGSLRRQAFTRQDGAFLLKPEFRRGVRFLEQDIREAQPEGPFDLVLCRNLVFTYFDDDLQTDVLGRIVAAMQPGAALVLGLHENLPTAADGLSDWFDGRRIFRKTTDRRNRLP
jgi:chemotaxis protein methyltransferase CheR